MTRRGTQRQLYFLRNSTSVRFLASTLSEVSYKQKIEELTHESNATHYRST